MTKDEALKMALETLGLAKHSHGVLLLSDPPQEAWKTYQVDAALSKTITAIKEALAQRTWVAIDDEDYIKTLELCDFDKDAAFEFFEAALKAKNT